MARPKRTKVASSTSRVAPVAKTRIASDNGTEVSDDSQGFVVTKKTRAGSKSHRSTTQDVTMTGALPVANTPEGPALNNKRPRNAIKRKELGTNQSKVIEALKKRRDEAKALKEGGNVPKQPSRSKAERATQKQAEDQTDATHQTPKVVPQATAKDGAAVIEESELSLPSPSLGDETFETNSPQSIRRPQSALKGRGTPGLEQSMLTLGNFKRRPRQPSILRMVQHLSDDEADNLDVDLADFNPDDESTPINVKKTSDVLAHSADKSESELARTSSSRKRKRGAVENRVDKSTVGEKDQDPTPSVVQVIRSSPPPLSSPTRRRETSRAPSESSSSLSVVQQSQPVDDPVPNETQDLFSETMAPPLSSSPPLTSPVKVSPPKPRKRGAGRKTAPKAASTATLQSMLPRRRNRMRRGQDELDILMSSEAEADAVNSDQDELQRPNNRRPTALTKTPANAKKRKPPARTKTIGVRKGGSPLKSTRTPAKPTKTYGRRVSSDKENDGEEGSTFVDADGDEEDDTLQIGDASTSAISVEGNKRLEAAVKKFADVDEWEMEFESCDLTGGSSSPWR